MGQSLAHQQVEGRGELDVLDIAFDEGHPMRARILIDAGVVGIFRTVGLGIGFLQEAHVEDLRGLHAIVATPIYGLAPLPFCSATERVRDGKDGDGTSHLLCLGKAAADRLGRDKGARAIMDGYQGGLVVGDQSQSMARRVETGGTPVAKAWGKSN